MSINVGRGAEELSVAVGELLFMFFVKRFVWTGAFCWASVGPGGVVPTGALLLNIVELGKEGNYF